MKTIRPWNMKRPDDCGHPEIDTRPFLNSTTGSRPFITLLPNWNVNFLEKAPSHEKNVHLQNTILIFLSEPNEVSRVIQEIGNDGLRNTNSFCNGDFAFAVVGCMLSQVSELSKFTVMTMLALNFHFGQFHIESGSCIHEEPLDCVKRCLWAMTAEEGRLTRGLEITAESSVAISTLTGLQTSHQCESRQTRNMSNCAPEVGL
jgi:hypothetical protein